MRISVNDQPITLIEAGDVADLATSSSAADQLLVNDA